MAAADQVAVEARRGDRRADMERRGPGEEVRGRACRAREGPGLLLSRLLDLAHRLGGLRLGLVDERVPRLTHELALRLGRRERHPDGRPHRQRDGAEREGVLLRDPTGVVADLARDVLDLIRHLAGGLLDLTDDLAGGLLDLADLAAHLVRDALPGRPAAAVAGVAVAGRVPRLAGHPAAVAEGLSAPVAAPVAPVVVAAARRAATRGESQPAEADADHRRGNRVAADRLDDPRSGLLRRLPDVSDDVAGGLANVVHHVAR